MTILRKDLDAMILKIKDFESASEAVAKLDEVLRIRTKCVKHANETLMNVSSLLDMIERYVIDNIDEDEFGKLSNSIAAASQLVSKVWMDLDEEFRPPFTERV